MTTQIFVTVGHLQDDKAVDVFQVPAAGGRETRVGRIKTCNTMVQTNVWDGTNVLVRETPREEPPEVVGAPV